MSRQPQPLGRGSRGRGAPGPTPDACGRGRGALGPTPVAYGRGWSGQQIPDAYGRGRGALGPTSVACGRGRGGRQIPDAYGPGRGLPKPPPDSYGRRRGSQQTPYARGCGRTPPGPAKNNEPKSGGPLPAPEVVPAATPDQCDTLKDVQPNWSELRKQGLSDMSEKRDDSSRLTLTEEEAVVFRGLLFDSPDGGRLSGKQLENRMKVMLQKHWDEMDGSPFHSAITMAVKSPDFKSVLSLFAAWFNSKVESARVELRKFLSPEFKKAVFKGFLEQRNHKVVEQAFHLCDMEETKMDFLEDIALLLKEGKFVTALNVAGALKLHDHFDKEAFLIPLIVEDKSDVVEQYIESHKHLQVELIKWLDSLIPSNLGQVSALLRSHPTKGARASRLYSKPLGRFIEKWIDKFGLDHGIAPNHYSSRKAGSFRFLVGQKDEAKIRLENWRDLIYENIKDDQGLQYDLLRYLTEGRFVNYDIEEAIYWVRKLNLNHARTPWIIQKELGLHKEVQYQQDDECWDDDDDSVHQMKTEMKSLNLDCNGGVSSDYVVVDDEGAVGGIQYYHLGLPRDCISFIDDKPGFTKFLQNIVTANVTALDLEYRPTSLMSEEKVAILQIACKSHVFILDMNSLSQVLCPSDWEEFIQQYFVNPKILLLGFGIRGDFQVLAKSLSAFREIESRSEIVLDLDFLDKMLTGASSSVQLQKPYDSYEKGLSALVESLLGLPLNKLDQMSDWNKRPLTENQVIYAALDAFVLLEVFEALKKISEDKGASAVFEWNVQELIRSKNRPSKINSGANKKNSADQRARNQRLAKEARELAERGRTATPLNEDPIEPSQLQVVCDSMLQGLCKKLRLHGVDAIAIESFEPYENCAKISQRDGRSVLTKGPTRAVRLQELVKKGHCLNLFTDKPADQVEEVFRYFNVRMEDRHYFTRCPMCNSDHYIIIPKKQMARMKERELTDAPSYTIPAEEAYLTNEDDDDDFSRYEVVCDPGDLVNCQGGLVDIGSRKTADGVSLLLKDVPEGVIAVREEFYACSGCGKIFWQGSHWERMKQQVNLQGLRLSERPKGLVSGAQIMTHNCS